MAHPQPFDSAEKLASPLKIAAEVDAALAAAGLDGPQVEREAIPLYLNFLQEMLDVQGQGALDFIHKGPEDIARNLVAWAQEQPLDNANLAMKVESYLQEVELISSAHGTLSEMKRRKLLNLHQRILQGISQCSVSQSSISTSLTRKEG